MAGKSISNAVRKIAEKAIAQKYPNAGMYAVDKARGEGRSVISAAQHAKFTENFREANQQAVSRRKSNSAAVAKVVAPKTKTSGLQGRDGVLGGQHAGGHSDVSGMSITNIGGETLKTPIVKPISSKNK